MVGTIVVGFAKCASYCGLIFVDRGIPQNPQKFIHLENFYAYGVLDIIINDDLKFDKSGRFCQFVT